jgi:succinate dehydrogenase / fumarate reductase cytochrome b subunit
MAQIDRPLSPYLVYRWEISNTLSFLHRMTGVMLSIGSLALVGWLISVVSGHDAYARLTAFFAGIVGGLILFALTFCFFYHLANGVRHLFWDAGYGFEKQHARMSGWAVVISALLLTLGFWIFA